MKYSWWWKWILTMCYSSSALSHNQQCHYIKSDHYMYCNQVTINVLRTGEYPMNNSEIKKIRLENTNLSKLEYNVFYNLINIVVLDLSKNALQDLDYRLFYNSKQLNKLYVAHNDLRTLDERLFNGLHNLTHLNLAYNKLIYLPISKIFDSQKNLIYLSLEGNNLKSIAIKILMPLNELKVLKMLNNPFNCNCTMWNTINWAKSKCLKMTATCNSPKKLYGKSWKEITITTCKNHVSSIKSNCSMKSCIYISRLGLMDCSDLKMDYFTSYDQPFRVRTLLLHNNELKVLTPNVFQTFLHLQSLNLRFNQISQLETAIFINLTNLKYLDLSKNKLTHLKTQLFTAQRMLISLKIQENCISTISVEVFKPLISLQRLNIFHNPLVFDQNLKEIFDWSLKQNIILEAMSNRDTNYKEFNDTCCTRSFSMVNVLVSALCSFLLVFIPLSVGTGIYYYTWTRKQSQKGSPVVKLKINANESSTTVKFRKNTRCNTANETSNFKNDIYALNEYYDVQDINPVEVGDTKISTNTFNLQPTAHEDNASHSKESIYECIEARENSSRHPVYLSIVPNLPERPMNNRNVDSEVELDSEEYLQPIIRGHYAEVYK